MAALSTATTGRTAWEGDNVRPDQRRPALMTRGEALAAFKRRLLLFDLLNERDRGVEPSDKVSDVLAREKPAAMNARLQLFTDFDQAGGCQ